MNDIPNTRFGFSGHIDFEDPEIPVLTMQIPIKILKRLIASSPSVFLEVKRSEIVGLLKIIAANPETPDAEREIVKNLLGKSNGNA
jgi:hypothetical protein